MNKIIQFTYPAEPLNILEPLELIKLDTLEPMNPGILEPFLKDEQFGTTKGFFLSSAAWMVAGTLAGFIGAIELVAPDLLGNLPWIVFGRIRQVHTNLVMFAFVGSALLGAAYYLVPTLVRTPLYSERLGKLSLWLWNGALVAGVITLSLGYTQNREYAEFIWPIDIGVLIVFALIFYNLFETLRRRQGKSSLCFCLVCIRCADLQLFHLFFWQCSVEP